MTEEGSLNCDHVECGNIDKVWQPHLVRGFPGGLKPHPYCVRCGYVKNIGSDRAAGIGYFINVISQIEKRMNIKGGAVRMRLAVMELEKIEGFDDAYSMTRYSQEKIFIDIIKRLYLIPERTIEQFL